MRFSQTGTRDFSPFEHERLSVKGENRRSSLPFNHASFAAAMRGITPHRMACA